MTDIRIQSGMYARSQNIDRIKEELQRGASKEQVHRKYQRFWRYDKIEEYIKIAQDEIDDEEKDGKAILEPKRKKGSKLMPNPPIQEETRVISPPPQEEGESKA